MDSLKDVSDFYASILNISNVNNRELIEKIVHEQVQELRKVTNDFGGFCRVIANYIEDEFRKNNILYYYIDLKKIIGVDHVFLIAEYKDNGIKRMLIDPSFCQFLRIKGYKVRGLEEWPSDRIQDKQIVVDLCTKGFIEIDNKKFSDYMCSFMKNRIEFNLDEFLIKIRLNSSFGQGRKV